MFVIKIANSSIKPMTLPKGIVVMRCSVLPMATLNLLKDLVNAVQIYNNLDSNEKKIENNLDRC